jgi:trehalose synthase
MPPNQKLASRFGQKAKETVLRRFLMTRLMEEWLDLLGALEAGFRLRGTGET